MKRTLSQLTMTGLVAYLGLCAWLYASQDRLLYYPTPEVTTADAEVLKLDTGDATLKIWQLGGGDNAVIYFGGNGEDVSRNINNFRGLLPNTAVYLLNYRGYGGSSGEPGEAAFFNDALLLFDFLKPKHSNISVIGRSLGSGVAARLAANRPVHKLVMVTPYDSIEEIAASQYPFAPISLLLRDKFRTIDYVDDIKAPVLVLIAEVDNIVPHANTLNLVGQFPPGQVSTLFVPNSNHRTIGSAPEYFDRIRRFVLSPEISPEDNRNPTLQTSL